MSRVLNILTISIRNLTIQPMYELELLRRPQKSEMHSPGILTGDEIRQVLDGKIRTVERDAKKSFRFLHDMSPLTLFEVTGTSPTSKVHSISRLEGYAPSGLLQAIALDLMRDHGLQDASFQQSFREGNKNGVAFIQLRDYSTCFPYLAFRRLVYHGNDREPFLLRWEIVDQAPRTRISPIKEWFKSKSHA